MAATVIAASSGSPNRWPPRRIILAYRVAVSALALLESGGAVIRIVSSTSSPGSISNPAGIRTGSTSHPGLSMVTSRRTPSAFRQVEVPVFAIATFELTVSPGTTKAGKSISTNEASSTRASSMKSR